MQKYYIDIFQATELALLVLRRRLRYHVPRHGSRLALDEQVSPVSLSTGAPAKGSFPCWPMVELSVQRYKCLRPLRRLAPPTWILYGLAVMQLGDSTNVVSTPNDSGEVRSGC